MRLRQPYLKSGWPKSGWLTHCWRTSGWKVLTVLSVSVGLMAGGVGIEFALASDTSTPILLAAKGKNQSRKVETVASGAMSPLEIVQAPETYLNKTVSFEAEFTSFSTLGLDYEKVLRESKEYVGVLVRRPDATESTIPLSEFKLFYPREKGESVMTVEPGDKVRVKAKIFATALGEPWADILALDILEKKNPPEEATDHQAEAKK